MIMKERDAAFSRWADDTHDKGSRAHEGFRSTGNMPNVHTDQSEF